MPTSVISPSNLTLNVNITIPSLVPQSFDNSKVTCNHTYTEVLQTYAAGGLINCKITCGSQEYPAVFALQYDSPAFIFQSLNITILGTDPALDEHITYALVMGLNSWYLINIHPNILFIQDVSGKNILSCTFDHLYNHAIHSRDILAVQYLSSIFFLSYCDTNAIKFNYIPAGNFLDQQQIVFTPQNVMNDSSYVIADVQNYSNIPDTAYFTYTVSQDNTNSYVLSLSDSVKNKLNGVVNPNLLDNWYFGNPVNQRGKTSYTGGGYCIDRWIMTGDTPQLTVTSGSIKGVGYLVQKAEVYTSNYLEGMQLTLSALMSDNNFGSITFNLIKGMENLFAINSNGYIVYAEWANTNDFFSVNWKTDSEAVGLVAVKLEIGSQQTLAHQENGVWVLNEIPDYNTELLNCQRYFQVIGSSYESSGNGVAIGYANNSIDFWVNFNLSVPMRTSPVPSIPDISLFKLGKINTDKKDITKAVGGWATRNEDSCNMRSIIFTSSGLTPGDTYVLYMNQGAKILLSADL